MHVRVEAELGIDAKVYLMERDGAAFRSFIAEEMSLLEYDIIKCWTEGRVCKIKIASKPDVSAWIPGPLAAKVPEKLEYHDTVAYDPQKLAQAPYELSVQSEAPFLGEKGYFASRTLIEPLGPGRCRHVLEQEIRFKGLWGLGAMAQKLAKKSLEQTFAEMPAIVDKWVQVREELLLTPHGRERLLAGRPKIQGVPWIDEYVAALQQHGSIAGQPKQKKKRLHRQNGKHYHCAEAQTATSIREMAVEAAAADLAVAAPLHVAGYAKETMPISAFANAAEAAPKTAFGATPATPNGQQPASAEDSGAAIKAAAPAVDDDAGFYDARERPGRQSTGETVYLSPSTSLAVAASDAPPTPVQGQRPTAAGKPLPAAGAGAEHAECSRAGSSASSSASSASDESQESQEDWSQTAPWRAYYSQHGLQPLRREHTLPEPLVRKFIAAGRPQPVSAHRLSPGAASGGSKGGGMHSKIKSMFAPCLGTATTATAK